ncbi:hypothetical protein IW261DRAFT_1423125 [Armillaria novae-zelandiae]|uniref:Uncharacterized protein n=1 Tax=Armillaria novae-zelandiae TaxID=153914 RepID=A0AA39U4Q5_9AGAR|nr:hypothetical protein IW261DRAFT_1423125 [Armillaria novae-zelandiae]
MRWQLHIEPGYQMGMNGLPSLDLDNNLEQLEGMWRDDSTSGVVLDDGQGETPSRCGLAAVALTREMWDRIVSPRPNFWPECGHGPGGTGIHVLEKGGEMESHSDYGKERIAVPPVAKNLDLAYCLNLKGSPSPMSDVEKLASQIGAAPTSVRRDTPKYTVAIMHQRRCFRFAFHTCLSRHDVSFVPASAHPLQDNRPQFVVDSAFGRLRMLVFSGGTQKMTVPTAEYVKLILVGINKMEERDTMWTLLEENSGKGKELDRVHLAVFKEEGNEEWKDIASRRKAGKESMTFVGINIRISACRHCTRIANKWIGRGIRAQVRVTASTVFLRSPTATSGRHGHKADFAKYWTQPSTSKVSLISTNATTPKKVIELASLFVASINHGILSHTVAIVVVVGFSLSTILSRFKPGAMVKTLSKTVEETHFQYDEHKDILDESAGFEDKINRLRVEALKLQERRLEVHGDVMSWVGRRSWGRYIGEIKAIWVKARQHQREIAELKKELQLAVVTALRDEVQADLAHHGQGGGDERERRT